MFWFYIVPLRNLKMTSCYLMLNMIWSCVYTTHFCVVQKCLVLMTTTMSMCRFSTPGVPLFKTLYAAVQRKNVPSCFKKPSACSMFQCVPRLRYVHFLYIYTSISIASISFTGRMKFIPRWTPLALSLRKGTENTNDVRNSPLFLECCYFKIASTRCKAILIAPPPKQISYFSIQTSTFINY